MSDDAAIPVDGPADNSPPYGNDESAPAVDPQAATVIGAIPSALGSSTEKAGDSIGRYKLLGELGVGGFGIVWRAEQTEPIHRAVALKVIKPGMDSAEIIARFEAERQALALMDHPNIAGVLDAGTTDSGRPYFVMELVRGTPITEYCDAHQLTIRQRLKLFIPVCQAVQHAHQKAILHRDLKPSNILVTELDGKPLPKIIDFGIAKALGISPEAALQGSLLQTQQGAVIGTLQYMSPEQAGAGADMDTRSDIYTLGVILYELLTGNTPLPREQLRKAAFDEVLRLIREADPVRPSSRVVPVTDLVRQTSTARHTESAKLHRALRGDLDWITLKALEKERERRYGSAAALAQDLERHLKNEPVEAGPPSAFYRLRKMVRRNRLAFGAATFIVLLLVAGITVSTREAAWAMRAEALATTRLKEANAQTERATIAEKLAKARLEEATSQAERAMKAETLAKSRLEDAARTEQILASENFVRGQEADGFAHLARAISYLPSSSEPAERAVRALMTPAQPPPILVLQSHGSALSSAQFDPDGQRIVTASKDGTARIWDAVTGQLLATLQGHKGTVTSAQFSPDGRNIVTTSSDTTARLWDTATGKILATLQGHRGSVTSAEFSPDGRNIVTASSDTTARLWDTATGKLLNTFRGHEARVSSAHFSADGQRIVTASEDKTARLWDAITGKILATLQGHRGSVTSAQFSPDGKSIVTASSDKTARLWDTATGEFLNALQGHESNVDDAQFSSDGKRIVTVSEGDKTARVWDAATYEVLATLQGHEFAVYHAEFSKDDKCILTASHDTTARVWESSTGKLLATLHGHEGAVFSAHFSPDAKSIVTASEDSTARVWELATDRLLATVLERENMGESHYDEELPDTAGPPPDWFRDFLHYIAQKCLNTEGAMETIKTNDWLTLREKLRAIVRESAGKDDPYLKVLRRWVDENDGAQMHRRARAYSDQGDEHFGHGNLAAAAKSYQQDLKIMQRLVAREPENMIWQHALSESLINVGSIQQAQGDLAVAAKSYQHALEITQQLVVREPENMKWQHALSRSLINVGSIQQARGDLADAAKSYQQALEITQRLVVREPEITDFQPTLGMAFNGMGAIQQAQGDLAGAEANYAKALEIALRLDQAGKFLKGDAELPDILRKSIEAVRAKRAGTPPKPKP